MPKPPRQIDHLSHETDRRRHIPTAEAEPLLPDDQKTPIMVAFERRNPDLDPQLIWRNKFAAADPLEVPAPPLYIQEKIHPRVLVEDLRRMARSRADAVAPQLSLFDDFNGLPSAAAATEFYQHDAHWSNRLILGDSLQVMASLAEREGLRGQVQCIYLDPPYGIKFNSNFQWSTTSRDVKDGNRAHITREPEQVRAFRDTWRDGIHSYLSYLRDRLLVARDLLADSGSIFVQIGDENVHRVRAIMDEVFGEDNFVSQINFKKTSALTSEYLSNSFDYIIWYGKNSDLTKYRNIAVEKGYESDLGFYSYIEEEDGTRRKINTGEIPNSKLLYSVSDLTSSHDYSEGKTPFIFQNRSFAPPKRFWTTSPIGMNRLARSNRIHESSNSIRYIRFLKDYPVQSLTSNWTDTLTGQYSDPRVYVVQTATKVIQRCILMATDPGDLVLDPTCGSGTTAFVAEQWGRRWITIDTSRVALALARARIMGARYPYYLLADSPAGQLKEAETSRSAPSEAPTYGNLRQGFVYERVPHITLKSIANNAEIDVIWEEYQAQLEPLRTALNSAVGQAWAEWEIPREAAADWSARAQELHAEWWRLRIARQRKIDTSIQARADQEFLYDRPYEDKNTVRVAGPFTVESLSPHRVLIVDEYDALRPEGRFVGEHTASYSDSSAFVRAILENLKAAGVQQAHRENRISFSSLEPWPGRYICAEGRYLEGDNNIERRAGVFIGPEFGTVARHDLVAAAREAADAGFDVLIACAFNYDAHSTEFERLGRIPVLKARMNADLHMADALKSTGAGNLFVIFGEPDIAIDPVADGQLQVTLRGVDIFKPQSGSVESSEPDDIACWFIDTDYNEESFFVRHAYFLGASDPYKSLRTTLKAEIDAEAWESLYGAVSRPFARPATGRIAVKVINHLGDEVMKVFSV